MRKAKLIFTLGVALFAFRAAPFTAPRPERAAMPREVKEAVDRSCGRCHSSDLPRWAASPVMLATACASLQAGIMPPPAYRTLKPEARLTQREVSAFCAWTSAAGGQRRLP